MSAGKASLGRLIGVDPALLEMAEVFRMPAGARLRYLYLPALSGKNRRPQTSAGKADRTAPSSVGEKA